MSTRAVPGLERREKSLWGASVSKARGADCTRISLVGRSDSEQIERVKATVAALHREPQRLVKPVVNRRNSLVVIDRGRARMVPLPTKIDRKKALKILRSMRGLELPVRK